MNHKDSVNEYSKEIPEEIKLSIKALADDTRLSILILLLKKKKMSFTKLKETLNLSSSSLSNHLAIMQDGGIVNNFLEWNEKSYSYYKVTDLGINLIKSIFKVVGYRSPIEPFQYSLSKTMEALNDPTKWIILGNAPTKGKSFLVRQIIESYANQDKRNDLEIALKIQNEQLEKNFDHTVNPLINKVRPNRILSPSPEIAGWI